MASEVQDLLEHFRTHEVFATHGIEDIIVAVRDMVEEDLRNYVMNDGGPYSDATVVACLEACINHLGDARTAYYASLK